MMRNKQELEDLYYRYEEQMQSELVTDEIARLRRQIIEETDALEQELTLEQKDKLEHILELEHSRGGELDKEVFIWAFAFAIRLITAGLNVDAEGVDDGK